MEDWSLQSILPKHDINEEHEEQLDQFGSFFGPIDLKQEYDQALLFSFPHLFDGTTTHPTSSTEETATGNELDRLYKPFYPIFEGGTELISPEQQPSHHLQSCQEAKLEHGCHPSDVSRPILHVPKLKKRKNQQKRVVVQVTAEGLSSDVWAWRKYGQKPIKGSPYPRSYYRCSSSKGCLARRQVEQSCTDPGIYLLTYTAEHNHPQPTRRNSLAGVNRNKFRTTPPKSPDGGGHGKTTTKSKDSPVASPTTPSFSSIDEEILQQMNPIKQEQTAYSEFNNHNNDDFVIPDMMFSDDFFSGLEDLGGLNSDISRSYGQFPVSFVS